MIDRQKVERGKYYELFVYKTENCSSFTRIERLSLWCRIHFLGEIASFRENSNGNQHKITNYHTQMSSKCWGRQHESCRCTRIVFICGIRTQVLRCGLLIVVQRRKRWERASRRHGCKVVLEHITSACQIDPPIIHQWFPAELLAQLR